MQMTKKWWGERICLRTQQLQASLHNRKKQKKKDASKSAEGEAKKIEEREKTAHKENAQACTEKDKKIDWLIDSLLFEYGNFISYITSLHESRIETEVNTVQLH